VLELELVVDWVVVELVSAVVLEEITADEVLALEVVIVDKVGEITATVPCVEEEPNPIGA
jgi:hypothetical protein